MKKIRFLVSLVAVAIVVSCQQENKLEQFDNEVKKENIVSLETAKDVAFFYLHKNKNVPNTRSRQADEVKIESSFSINDENAEPVMHVVNYEGGGFAIISGDNRIEPLLAYADEGEFGDNELDYPGGLSIWIDQFENTIKYIRDNDVALPEELAKHWEICASIGESRAIPEQGLDCEDGEKIDEFIVGPLLLSKWDQVLPYNMGMPMIQCAGQNVNAYVGCQHLAVAQILHYWKYPGNYDWTIIPNATA